MSRDTQVEDIVVGEMLGPLEVVVDEKMVREYCNEFRDHNPMYLEDSPFGGTIVPSAYMEGITGSRLLGTRYNAYSSFYEYINPARVGKRLTTTGRIIAKHVKRGLEYVVIEAMMLDEDGLEIRRNFHHIILGLERRATTSSRHQPVTVEDGDAARRTSMSGRDIGLLREIPSLRKTAYQRELHEQVFPATSIHNPAYARSKSYAGALVSGYVLGCYMSEMLLSFFGPNWLRGGAFEVTFINGGVQEGDEVICRGAVVERSREAVSIRANLDVWIEKGQGVKVVVGKASGILEE